MNKTLLLIFAVIVLVFKVYANEQTAKQLTAADAENSVIFSYCTDDMDKPLSFSDKIATVRVAVLIPKSLAAKYANAQITKIHAGIGSSASSTKVFIIEGLENLTFTYSQSATLAKNSWTEVTLNTPYTITGNTDLLIGYEYRGAGTTIGVDNSIEVGENCNYYCDSGSSEWRKMNDHNFTVKATITGNALSQQDISILSVKTNTLRVFPDEPFSVTTTIYNNAIEPVTNFKAVYEVGNTVIEENITGITLNPFRRYTFSKELSFSTDGYYQTKVSVSEPNRKPDDDATDNSMLAANEVWVGAAAPTRSLKRNALIEEFTGIHCTWCPVGHKLANQLKEKYSGRVCVINIHQGYFANPYDGEPDFKTSFGDALANQAGISSYPSATVNRHVFSGYMALNERDSWEPSVTEILDTDSPVNLIADAQINWDTRVLTVDVKGYYTGNSNTSTNNLNVALLQNNILATQIGGNGYPEMWKDGIYRHNHMLRHLLTGQWGAIIQPTTTGSSFSQQYTYTIPEKLNDVPVELKDLSVVVFIAEGNKEVITATEARVQYAYLTTPLIEIMEMKQLPYHSADDKIQVQAVVKNISPMPVASYQLQYGITSNATYVVSGKNLQINEMDTLLLPLIPTELRRDMILTLSVSKVNDKDPVIQLSSSLTVMKDISFTESNKLKLNLWQDKYGTETTWKWFDPNGKIILEGGPYTDLTSDGVQLHQIDLPTPFNGVYRFEIYDEFGDGINSGAGEGKYEITTDIASNGVVTTDNGKFGKKGLKYISVGLGNAINNPEDNAFFAVSVRNNMLYIDSSEAVKSVTVYNISGQVMLHENGNRTIPVDMLPAGVYIVKVKTANREQLRKVLR
ncbi:MAG: Omp28-related outer membrane protein [Dysgonamonadaceae bacterium]|nr:Omp28-related outer membrane protein [Dysgonamonadaceae bacterium]